MMFVYEVNGSVIEDTVAFGEGWARAKEIAKAEHSAIFRQTIRGEEIRNEFFAIGGIFLNERFYSNEKVYIF